MLVAITAKKFSFNFLAMLMMTVMVFFSLAFADKHFHFSNQIQEAAYMLASGGDTLQAKTKLENYLKKANSANAQRASKMELLTAHLYLAKIAETKSDSASAAQHYKFIKDNAPNQAAAYSAAASERKWRGKQPDVQIARVAASSAILNLPALPQTAANNSNSSPIQDPRFANCINEGELTIAQHTVYNCPDNALHLVSKSGSETWSIPFTESPALVFLDGDGLFLYYENSLSYYKLQDGLEMLWRMPTLEIQDVKTEGENIFALDVSGKIKLLQKNSSQRAAETASDGEHFFNAGIGLVGTYQKNGGISVFDSLLRKLFDYQIDGKITSQPIIKSDSVIFNLSNGEQEIINTRIYEKLEHPQEFVWSDDWEKNVIYGMRHSELSKTVFAKYAEKIGAKWVRKLSTSSKMLYPKIISDANTIFVLDYETQNLLKFSAENGNNLGNIGLPNDRRYSVADEHSPWLMLTSAFKLSQFSLYNSKSLTNDIPGKPFSFLWNKDSLYVGLWNGFVLKYFIPKMRLEWSKKVSSTPVFLAHGANGIYSLSQGKVTYISNDARNSKADESKSEFNLDVNNVSYFKYKSGIFAIALENGEIRAYSGNGGFSAIGSFSVNSPIVSLELLENGGKVFALAGKADQTLSLYELPSGSQVWTYKSRGSAFLKGILHSSNIYLDQDGEVVAIDAMSGKIVKKYSILGNGASLYIANNTLYCATPQKLLYSFALP